MTAKVCSLWLFGLAGILAAYAPRLEAAGTEFGVQLEPERQTLELWAAQVSGPAGLRAEAQLDACVAKVEKTVRRQGEAVVALRMARELGIEPAALMTERASLGCFLGDLLIAHSIRANAHTGLSAARLVELHAGGMDWAEIAVGLGLRLNQVVRGLINETRVVAGLSRGDGRIAAMRSEDVRGGPLAGAPGAAGAASSEIASGP